MRACVLQRFNQIVGYQPSIRQAARSKGRLAGKYSMTPLPGQLEVPAVRSLCLSHDNCLG